MRIVAIRVRRFRAIKDTGWVTLNPLTGIVGENESGKTSFLVAISKIAVDQKFGAEDTSSLFDDGEIGVSAQFKLSDDDFKQIVKVTRKPLNPNDPLVLTKDGKNRYTASIGSCELFKSVTTRKFNASAAREKADSWTPELEKNDRDLDKQLSDFVKNRKAEREITDATLSSLVDEIIGNFDVRFGTPAAQLKETRQNLDKLREVTILSESEVVEWEKRYSIAHEQAYDEKKPCVEQIIARLLPKFLYFDKYDVLQGTYKLEDLKKLDQFATINKLLRLAKLNADQVFSAKEVQRKQFEDKAAAVVKGLLDRHWTQKKVKVCFRFGEEQGIKTLNLLVETEGSISIPFVQRSDGFKWFLSFYAAFNDANDDLTNTVLLLDDPAVSLHAKGQRDAYEAFERLSSRGNSIIFSTHSPFLVDLENLQRYRIAENKNELHAGVTVSFPFSTADAPTIQPLLTAMGCPLGSSFVTKSKFLVPEGPIDYYLLHAIARIGVSGGGLDPSIGVSPAANAGDVLLICAVFHALDKPHVGLLDGDVAGHDILTRAKKRGLDTVLNLKGTNELMSSRFIESIFGYDLYAFAVARAHRLDDTASEVVHNSAPPNEDFKGHVQAQFKKHKLGVFSGLNTAAELANMFDPLNESSGFVVTDEVVSKCIAVTDSINRAFGVTK